MIFLWNSSEITSMIELNIQISKKKYSVSFTNKSFWCIAVLQLPLLYWKSEILQISRQSKHVDVTIVQTQYSSNTMNFVYAFRNMWEFKVSKVQSTPFGNIVEYNPLLWTKTENLVMVEYNLHLTFEQNQKSSNTLQRHSCCNTDIHSLL